MTLPTLENIIRQVVLTLLTLVRSTNPTPRVMITLMSSEKILNHIGETCLSLLGRLIYSSGLTGNNDLGTSITDDREVSRCAQSDWER